MKLAFKLALRFLTSSRGQTILILLGIAIGVSVQIFIGSLIDGLQRSLIDKTIGSASHITIKMDEKNIGFNQPDELLGTLRARTDIKIVSETLDAAGFITDEQDANPVQVRGLELPAADQIYKFSSRLIEGKLPLSANEGMVGKDLAKKAGIKVGDWVTLTAPPDLESKILVTGIFDLKVAAINQSWLVTNLATAQTIFKRPDLISSIEMQVGQVFKADSIAADLKPILPPALIAVNWKEQNEELLSGLSGQSASSYMIQVFVMLAVLLGISSVLAISVVQKSRQIGILKAMGIKDRTASRIFMLQGLILGTAGAAVGTLLGIGFSFAFSTFVKSPDGTSLVPFYLDARFIGLSIVIAILAAAFAALIPARKSSRLNPIEVIRNG